ncbi:MAG: hypothetical protein ACK2UX_13915, partial [Anaerolineae bacterium]
GAVMMNEICRKTVLEQWQKRKQEEITHPVLNEKMPLGLAFHAQAQLLARQQDAVAEEGVCMQVNALVAVHLPNP